VEVTTTTATQIVVVVTVTLSIIMQTLIIEEVAISEEYAKINATAAYLFMVSWVTSFMKSSLIGMNCKYLLSVYKYTSFTKKFSKYF
jgi:hypothetical protein